MNRTLISLKIQWKFRRFQTFDFQGVFAFQNVIGQLYITADVFRNGLVFKPLADVTGFISMGYPTDGVFRIMGIFFLKIV